MDTGISEEKIRTAGRPGSLIRTIGNTPLISLGGVASDLPPEVELFGKAEWLNPGGSVKARPALAMVLGAIEEGTLTRDRRILDATSGNTGIAYATVGAVLGYEVTLCLPENATPERKGILSGLGAELILTDPEREMDGAIEKAHELKENNPGQYCYLDQYSNPLNWQSHYVTTGPELLRDTDGEITHYVAGLGTTGTFVGTGRRLREERSNTTLISFEPATALHELEGLKHLESAKVPEIYDPELADQNRSVRTEKALDMMHSLAVEEGLFVGPSAAAAVVVAREVARDIEQGTVVTILPDSGDKYMDLWTDEHENT